MKESRVIASLEGDEAGSRICKTCATAKEDRHEETGSAQLESFDHPAQQSKAVYTPLRVEQDLLAVSSSLLATKNLMDDFVHVTTPAAPPVEREVIETGTKDISQPHLLSPPMGITSTSSDSTADPHSPHNMAKSNEQESIITIERPVLEKQQLLVIIADKDKENATTAARLEQEQGQLPTELDSGILAPQRESTSKEFEEMRQLNCEQDVAIKLLQASANDSKNDINILQRASLSPPLKH